MKQQKKTPDLEQVRRAVPINAVLQRYGLLSDLKQSGAQLKGRCPIHDGDKKSRSFVVNVNTNVWKCFSPACARGGGTLELVAAIEQVDVRDAALLVARWFAISTEKLSNHQTRRSRT